MDYQRDYILRLIHMLGDMMRRLFDLLDDHQRFRLLDKTCREHCGMPLETAESLTMESLFSLLSSMPRFVLSELLAAKAEVATLPSRRSGNAAIPRNWCCWLPCMMKRSCAICARRS